MWVDYYSKYGEIVKLSGLSSETTITAEKSVFARHGIPDELMIDNRAQFKNAGLELNFKHTTSSPTNPRSDGQAERTVQIVKNLLK